MYAVMFCEDKKENCYYQILIVILLFTGFVSIEIKCYTI